MDFFPPESFLETHKTLLQKIWPLLLDFFDTNLTSFCKVFVKLQNKIKKKIVMFSDLRQQHISISINVIIFIPVWHNTCIVLSDIC